MIRLLSLVFFVALSAPLTAQQNPFETAILVNDRAITNYEIAQRVAFLRVLNAPGDLTAEARKALIEDRLRQQAADAAEIELTPEELREGMEEFAGRAELDVDQFIAQLEGAGVAEETFRDFVGVGLVWRQIVQDRFGPRAGPTDAEVDRAVSLSTTRSEVRALISEIILPLAPEVEAEARALIAELSRTIKTQDAFSAAAREYSAAPSRDQGGRLEWLPLGRLPAPLRSEVLKLRPGEVTDPIDLGRGIAIFQLRALEENVGVEAETLTLEYVKMVLPDLATARMLDANYDTCDDLYVAAKDLPKNALDRVSQASAAVPADIALELARLDDNETSHSLREGGFPVYLKLCGRSLAARTGDDGEEVDQSARIRERLFRERLTSFGETYIEQLRAGAVIVEKG